MFINLIYIYGLTIAELVSMSIKCPLLFLLIVFLGSHSNADGTAQNAQRQGLKWCGNFCLCSEHRDENLQCMESIDIYRSLNFPQRQINRLQALRFNPITTLKWCDSGRCFCNKDTDKSFDCVRNFDGIFALINDAAEMVVGHNPDTSSVQIAGFMPSNVGLNVTEADGIEIDPTHRKRDMDEEERKNRRKQNRKNNKKGKKKHRNETIDYDTHVGSDESEQFGTIHQDDNFDFTNTHMLPKQEAINSSPMVTAMKPPTRRQPVTLPASRPTVPPPQHQHNPDSISSSPSLQESMHPDFLPQNANPVPSDVDPFLDVSVHRQSIGDQGLISEKIRQINEDLKTIKEEGSFNQQILLITAGVAGAAMLG